LLAEGCGFRRVNLFPAYAGVATRSLQIDRPAGCRLHFGKSDAKRLAALLAFPNARNALEAFKVEGFQDAIMRGRDDKGAGLLVEYARRNG
jgi:hypothetical protein